MTKEKCGATWIGPWTGDTYVCNEKGYHLHHRMVNGSAVMEWPNDKDFCAMGFPGTHDFCKRPPQHKGLHRVKRFGKVISFR